MTVMMGCQGDDDGGCTMTVMTMGQVSPRAMYGRYDGRRVTGDGYDTMMGGWCHDKWVGRWDDGDDDGCHAGG